MLHDFDIDIRPECMIDAGQYDEQGDLTMNAYVTLADRWVVHKNFMIGNARIFVDDRRSTVRNREVVFKDLYYVSRCPSWPRISYTYVKNIPKLSLLTMLW